MKKKLVLIILLVFIFPLISANTLNMKEHNVFMKNYISNFEQFPDYEFILSVQYESSEATWIGFVNQSTGLIPVWTIGGSPLFGSVYALNKSYSKTYFGEKDWERIDYLLNLEDIGAKKVITHLELYKDVGLEIDNITNYYDVDLNITKSEPDRTEIQKSYGFIFNIISLLLFGMSPILILIIVLLIVFFNIREKRKKKK